jgi:probable HAF family extracellular repeat protein
MKAKHLTGIIAIAVLAALSLSCPLPAQDDGGGATRYVIIDLGTLGGTFGAGSSINNLGWSSGLASSPDNNSFHAALWLPGRTVDLGTLGGTNSAIEWPVKNVRGNIVGISETSTPDPLGERFSCTGFIPTNGTTCLGFLWHDGVMIPLPTLGGNNGFATGMNNFDQAVGWTETTFHDATCTGNQVLQFLAVIWGPRKGQIRPLLPLPRDSDTAATAINDFGQVVGISGICGDAIGAYSAKHSVLWQDGNPIELPTLGGAGWNTPMAINNRGVVVGFSDLAGDVGGGVLTPNFQAFLWTREGGIVNLSTLPGDVISEATGINEGGQVIGTSFDANGNSRVFLWQNNAITDLNTLVAPGSGSSLYLIASGDINDRGEITGQACVLVDGACSATTHTFLAIPVRGDWASGKSTSDTAAKIRVPEAVRRQILGRYRFGHVGPEPVPSQ